MCVVKILLQIHTWGPFGPFIPGNPLPPSSPLKYQETKLDYSRYQTLWIDNNERKALIVTTKRLSYWDYLFTKTDFEMSKNSSHQKTKNAKRTRTVTYKIVRYQKSRVTSLQCSATYHHSPDDLYHLYLP